MPLIKQTRIMQPYRGTHILTTGDGDGGGSGPLGNILSNIKEGFSEALKEDFIEGFEALMDAIGELMNLVIINLITPPQPRTSEKYIGNTEINPVSGFISDPLWENMYALNEMMTGLSVYLFGFLFIFWLISVGIGIIDIGEITESFWTIFIGFIVIVANEELMGLVWAFVHILAFEIISFEMSSGSGATEEIVGVSITGGFAYAAKGGLASAVPWVGLPVGSILAIIALIIIGIFMGLQFIAVLGYAIMPLLVFMVILSKVIPATEPYANKLTGFFVPPMFLPLLLAIVFKVSYYFILPFQFGTQEDPTTSQSSLGVTLDALGDLALLLIGPLLGVLVLSIGCWLALTSMKAGSAVVGGVTKMGMVGGSLAVAGATGGVGNVVRGLAKSGGNPSGAVAGLMESQFEDESAAAGDLSQNTFDQDLAESAQDSSVDPGKQSPFNGSDGFLSSYQEEMRELSTDTSIDRDGRQLRQSKNVYDSLDESDKGVLGGLNTTPERGMEKFKTNYGQALENVVEGNESAEAIAEAVIDDKIEMGADLGEGMVDGELVDFNDNPDLYKKQKMDEFRSMTDVDNPMVDDNIIDAQATQDFLNENTDVSERVSMGLAGTLNEGKAVTGQSIPQPLQEQFKNKEALQYQKSDPTAGTSTGRLEDANAEYVSIMGAQEGNEKSENLGYHATPTTPESMNTIDSLMNMKATEDELIEFELAADQVDLSEDNPLMDAKKQEDGTFVATPQQVSRGLNEVVDSVNSPTDSIISDREASTLVESAKKQDARVEDAATKDRSGLEKWTDKLKGSDTETKLSPADIPTESIADKVNTVQDGATLRDELNRDLSDEETTEILGEPPELGSADDVEGITAMDPSNFSPGEDVQTKLKAFAAFLDGKFDQDTKSERAGIWDNIHDQFGPENDLQNWEPDPKVFGADDMNDKPIGDWIDESDADIDPEVLDKLDQQGLLESDLEANRPRANKLIDELEGIESPDDFMKVIETKDQLVTEPANDLRDQIKLLKDVDADSGIPISSLIEDDNLNVGPPVEAALENIGAMDLLVPDNETAKENFSSTLEDASFADDVKMANREVEVETTGKLDPEITTNINDIIAETEDGLGQPHELHPNEEATRKWTKMAQFDTHSTHADEDGDVSADITRDVWALESAEYPEPPEPDVANKLTEDSGDLLTNEQKIQHKVTSLKTSVSETTAKVSEIIPHGTSVENAGDQDTDTDPDFDRSESAQNLFEVEGSEDTDSDPDDKTLKKEN